MRVSNIVVRDLKHEAVALDMFYTAAPPEPVSERTPHVRNVHISGITGTARGAGVLLGLDEARLDDVTLTDIDVIAETGIVIRNADHVTLRTVRIRTQGGPAVTAENAGDLRLFDVGTLAPHAGTPVVTLVNVSARVPAGMLRAPGHRHVPLGARARHQGDHHRRERSGGRAHAADAGRRRVADRDHSTMIGATVVVPAP